MIDKNKLNNEIEKAKSIINSSEKIVLINHRKMDWDAYGSLWAFYILFKKLWKQVIAINDDNTPKDFEFVINKEIFNTNSLKDFDADLIISLDAADKKQLGDIYKNNLEYFLERTMIVLDHHITNPHFGNINIINTNASSTCEISYELINTLWWEDYIDEDIATLLLTGLITDTNSFFNTNSSPRSLEIASKLMDKNARHQDIIINLFKKKTYSKIKLWWKVLESLKDINNWKIVWWIIPKNYFIETWSNQNEVWGLLDEFITTINTLEVWFLIYELSDGKIKWTFRWKSDKIDLAKFCEENFSWWWHQRAAWFLLEGGNIHEVELEVIEKLKQELK